MPKFFVENNQIKNDTIYIKYKDVNHIKKVLRKNIEDEITICNENTKQDYLCKIKNIEENEITCKIIKELETNVESNIEVSIFQGLPKADKMELIIQKSVELGVHDITPIEMKRCVVKLQGKDRTKKIERWQKISEVAAKQCGRNYIPKINNIENLKEISEKIKDYDVVLVAYEEEKENTLKNELELLKKDNKEELKENKENKDNANNEKIKIAIVIGPEGGIDKEEINTLEKNGAKIITLGKRILRTETVALNVLSIIMYELES